MLAVGAGMAMSPVELRQAWDDHQFGRSAESANDSDASPP